MTAEYEASPWKVLIIGQDEADSESSLRILNAIGHWGYAPDSTPEARKLWASHCMDFDVVICDVANRSTLDPHLARRPPRTNPRVLFVSHSPADASLLEPGESLLVKPFTPGALHQALSQLMDRL